MEELINRHRWMTISHTWTTLWMTAGSRPALGVLNRRTETLHFLFQKASMVLLKRNSKPLRWWRKHVELGDPPCFTQSWSWTERGPLIITSVSIHRRIQLPEAEWHVCPCLRDGLNEENKFHCMPWTGLCVTNSDSSYYNWVKGSCQQLTFLVRKPWASNKAELQHPLTAPLIRRCLWSTSTTTSSKKKLMSHQECQLHALSSLNRTTNTGVCSEDADILTCWKCFNLGI